MAEQSKAGNTVKLRSGGHLVAPPVGSGIAIFFAQSPQPMVAFQAHSDAYVPITLRCQRPRTAGHHLPL